MREWMTPPGENPPYFSHSWIPWERIATILSYNAAEIPDRVQKTGEAIESGMASVENVHVRATIRSFSRGSEKIYVHDQRKRPRRGKTINESFPVVWIFDPVPEKNPHWYTLIESVHFLKEHLEGKTTFRKKIASGFSEMVAVFGYGREQPTKAIRKERHVECRSYRYDAMAIFSPLCWTRRQHAEWCEYSKCRRNPFVRGRGPYTDGVLFDASRHYERGRFQTLKRDLSSAGTLILTALPYADLHLTVVSPKGFEIEPAIYAEAAGLKKTIEHLPIDMFPEAHVKRMATCHLVPIREYNPLYVYPPGVAEAIGEEPALFADMVPDVIRDFHAGGYRIT